MRYYDIQITNSDGSAFRRYSSLQAQSSTSVITNMNALNIEMDIQQAAYNTPDYAGDRKSVV